MKTFSRSRLLIAAAVAVLGSVSLTRVPRAEEGSKILVCTNTNRGWENDFKTLKLYFDDNTVEFDGTGANANFGEDTITWQIPTTMGRCGAHYSGETGDHDCQPSTYKFDRNSGYLDEFVDSRLPGDIRYSCRRRGRDGD